TGGKGGIHDSMGGLKINRDGEVIDVEGDMIEGLYAGGEVGGGIDGGKGLGGNGVGDIFSFGGIGGESGVRK
ncbi:FAD-binding protein, partial [Staphylococcus epidermidis]|uniref:FAD-binding protein n=1 Tax=Staphylococcus epidermidis TaxID=1282 RepID=UPI0011A107FC